MTKQLRSTPLGRADLQHADCRTSAERGAARLAIQPSQCADAGHAGPTHSAASSTSLPQLTAPANAYAPDPLGPEWSSMAFSGGKCYDLDALYYAEEAACDVSLSADGWLITPQNGALFSGNGSLIVPSLNDCKAAQMSTDPIALMSDLYLCFKTNQGVYGFFVMREAPQSSGLIVFDAYLFP